MRDGRSPVHLHGLVMTSYVREYENLCTKKEPIFHPLLGNMNDDKKNFEITVTTCSEQIFCRSHPGDVIKKAQERLVLRLLAA